MKLPVIILLTSVALAGSGGFMIFKASRIPIDDREVDLNQPRHLVTQQMEMETAAMRNRKETQVEAETEQGARITVAPFDGERPQFVLFIKTDCPCSVDAQPLFNRLADRYKGKVDFLGVIDGDRAAAKSFASQYSSAFPVVSDKKLTIIHGFQALGGIYCALVARNGHLIKMWPGYSSDMLQEMNRAMAQATAEKEVYFDPQYAPKVRAAGCAYTGTW